MTLLVSTEDRTTTAVALVAFGYCVGTISIEEWERAVNAVLLPLYSCGVLGYLTIRVYHDYLAPRFSKPSKVVEVSVPVVDESITQAYQPINMSGAYKLVENQNFDEILAAQGIPWALRTAANRARPVHRFIHKGSLLTIKIEGVIESQTTYQVNGPPVQGELRGRRFEDTITYLDDDSGVQTMKRFPDHDYTIYVRRRLTSDRSQLIMTSTLKFEDESKGEIDCKQVFHRLEG